MLRYFGRLLSYQPPDLKSKLIFERAKRAKLKGGLLPHDLDDNAIAAESGLLEPSLAKVSDFEESRDRLLKMLEAQKRKRIARREAFLTWQSGQREKGAAHRLERQTRKQERYKRQHYHSQKGRLLPLSFTDEDGISTNRGVFSPSNNAEFIMTKSPSSYSDFLQSKTPSFGLRRGPK